MLPAKRGDFQMFAVVQKEKVFNEILLNHFKENKVEIANSITKLFPFLESLRDRSCITEKLYSDSQEAYRNLVPTEKIIYNVLGYLEKMLDWSLLKVLFSRVNLKEYPGLIEIQRSFEIELQDKYLYWKRDGEEQKMSTAQPSCEQGAIQSGRTSESISDMMSMHLKTDYSVADPNEDPKIHPTNYECVQSEINLCMYENYTQPCFVKQEQKPNIAQNQVNEIIVISSDSESSD